MMIYAKNLVDVGESVTINRAAKSDFYNVYNFETNAPCAGFLNQENIMLQLFKIPHHPVNIPLKQNLAIHECLVVLHQGAYCVGRLLRVHEFWPYGMGSSLNVNMSFGIFVKQQTRTLSIHLWHIWCSNS